MDILKIKTHYKCIYKKKRKPIQIHSKFRPNVDVECLLPLLSVSGQNGGHLSLGGVLLVLLEQVIATAHAPLVRPRQAGAVRPAGARAQMLPVVLASPGLEKVKYKKLGLVPSFVFKFTRSLTRIPYPPMTRQIDLHCDLLHNFVFRFLIIILLRMLSSQMLCKLMHAQV